MQAKFYDGQEKVLKDTVVQDAPKSISSLYHGKIIPFIWNGKLCGCSYEREINSFYIQRAISNSEIYRLVADKIAEFNEEALKEAAGKAERLIMQVTKDLDNIAPPWFE